MRACRSSAIMMMAISPSVRSRRAVMLVFAIEPRVGRPGHRWASPRLQQEAEDRQPSALLRTLARRAVGLPRDPVRIVAVAREPLERGDEHLVPVDREHE